LRVQGQDAVGTVFEQAFRKFLLGFQAVLGLPELLVFPQGGFLQLLLLDIGVNAHPLDQVSLGIEVGNYLSQVPLVHSVLSLRASNRSAKPPEQLQALWSKLFNEIRSLKAVQPASVWGAASYTEMQNEFVHQGSPHW
jgi:hypothetical protein